MKRARRSRSRRRTRQDASTSRGPQFDLQPKVAEAGAECHVGAVFKVLRLSGERVKTDKRNAMFLARMIAVGNMVEVAVPTGPMEDVRDLAHACEDRRHDLMRARHLVSKFLFRKGIAYEAGKKVWTKTYRARLASLEFADL